MEAGIDISARKKQLLDLNRNLNILLEREAKYGGHPPLELLNQIDDHRQAITLIEKALTGELTNRELDELLKPMLLALRNGQVINITAETYVAGDLIQNITHILTAAEEAAQVQELATQRLAEGVRDYLHRLQAIITAEPEMDGSPYKGLLAYRLSDAELFYGRDRAIGELLTHLQRNPLTILHAESGAGKSSLLQAGIANRLLGQGHLPVYLRPYKQSPTLAIKRTFLPNLTNTPELAEAPLRDFLRRVTSVLGPEATLYMMLDQFEEVFTLLDDAARSEFVAELATCLEDESLTVRWVLALRTEFFGNLANFRPRIRNPFENDFRLNRLNLIEAKTVISEPAARQGISFEPELVGKLLTDLHDEDNDRISPPQIQLVCSALYNVLLERRTENPDLPLTITLQMYDEEGQAQGILRGHLNRVLRRTLSLEEREAARQLLIAMVSSDQRRIRRTKSDLVATLATYLTSAMSLDNLLDQLVESRLLNVDRDDETGEGIYELAHDYLLAEIEVDPEIQAQKAAEELLERELIDWRQFGALMSPQSLRVVGVHRSFLTFDKDTHKLLLSSAFETDVDLHQWLMETTPDQARRVLLHGLRRDEPELRARGAKYLTDYFDEEVVEKLVQLAVEDNEKAVRQAALLTLDEHDSKLAQQVLLRGLESPSPNRRVEAAKALEIYLNTEIVSRLFHQLTSDDNDQVLEAVLNTLASDKAAPYRDQWRPLSRIGFWRSAFIYKKLRQLRIQIPKLTSFSLIPARFLYYLKQEAQSRPVWLGFRLALILPFYFAIAWWLGWWPFYRWEIFPNAPQTSFYSMKVIYTTPPIIYVGSADYGVARFDSELGWSSEWLRNGLPISDKPRKDSDPTSNVRSIRAIAVNSTNPNEVYVYTFNGGLSVTQDGGGHWTSIGSDFLPNTSQLSALDVKGNQILFTTEFGFYVSNDGGNHWVMLTDQNGLGEGRTVTSRFNSIGVPYVGGEDGLYRGEGQFPWIWRKISEIPHPVRYLDFGTDSQLYLALGLPSAQSVACYFPENGLSKVVEFETGGIAGITALVGHPKEANQFYVSLANDQTYKMNCNGDKEEFGQVDNIDGGVTSLALIPTDADDYLLLQTNSLGLYQHQP